MPKKKAKKNGRLGVPDKVRRLKKNWKFCPYCGADRADINPNRPFCGGCGKRVL